MYFSVKCPKCDKKLKVKEEQAGRKAGCPYCKAPFVVPRPPIAVPSVPQVDTSGGAPSIKSSVSSPTKQKPTSSPSSDSSGAAYDNGTDVSLLWSGLIALGVTLLFYAFVYGLHIALPDEWHYFSDLFLDRGKVPYALALMFFWSMVILAIKSRKLARQKGSMLFDVLPTEISETISLQTIDQFDEHVRDLPVDAGSSFLVNRVRRGLEHFRVRKSAAEVATILNSQSDLDANAVQSSYTMLKYFIWAIPILGFIGTVIGISAAVGGFSGNLDNADMEQIKASLNLVTGGLSTAFDTTLVALVMSIIVMFSVSSVQKAEDDVLGWVDEYCNENLLKRLDDGRGGGAARSQFTSSPEVQRAIDSAMAGHHAELQKWSERLESIGEQLTSHVTRGWTDINDQLAGQHQQKLAEFQQLDQLAQQVQSTLTDVTTQSQTLQTQVSGSMSESAESLQGYFGDLKRGLETLNEVLEKLGEQNVVVQVQQPKKRGWFGLSRNGGR